MKLNRGTGKPARPFVALLLVAFAAGCAWGPPREPEDLCAIFKERPTWHRAAKSAERRWGVPSPVMMAVMYKESSYVHDARPPRRKVFRVIPWKRESTAYGFAQATDAAWQDYRRDTGRSSPDRDDFRDAVDFVGWYLDRAHRQAGIDVDNAEHLYLAYYSGVGGYQRGAWRGNEWLRGAARRVAQRSSRYDTQLTNCKLKRRWWWFD